MVSVLSPTCDSALSALNPYFTGMRNLKTALYGLAALGLAMFGGPVAADTDSPVVVELYTSQGCSSCPPAEAFLGELAKRPNVIALEFHIDYWDYIGWKDPFASPDYTARQRAYSARMGERYVYTPQMVIQGQTHEVGSKRYLVEKKIALIRDNASPGPEVVLKKVDNSVQVTVNGKPGDDAYDVFFVTFDAKHETKILRGENRGKVLANTNVVRAFEHSGRWTGDSFQELMSLAGKKGDGGCAVIVQKANQGPITAAAVLAYKGS